MVEPLHFTNVKILWRGQPKKREDFEREDKNDVEYPSDPKTGPTKEKIEALKQKIARKMPEQFPMEILDKEYGWLEHDDDRCHYDPFKLEGHKHSMDTYGHREDVHPLDGFYSKEPAYRMGDL